MPECTSCGADVLDIDVKCKACGANLTPTGAHRLLGTTVLGQYKIIDVLGQGGMSVVYRAQHTLTEQDVALKVLPPELAAYSQVKSRFLEEAKALAQLDHPNIVHLYNFGQENGSFVLAMQFVHGQTWERMIIEGEGGQPWPAATRIAVDVLRGLEYAHGRGIVHRDMKPSNVLVRDDDGTATVMDFGIAKMTTSTRLTATGQTMGTVRYMSPEQVRGHEVDARSDIYSLGATLYEAVVGDTPFDGNTHFEIMSKHLTEAPVPPSQRGVQLPAVLEAALMKALAKKADDRFTTARELRKELELALKDADDVYSETQRVPRDVVSKVRAAATPAGARPIGPDASTVPTGRAAADSAPGAPALPRRDPGPPDEPTAAGRDANGAPIGRVTSIADQLEPDGPAAGPGKRRPWLWIGLGTVVLAAGAAVLVRTQLTDRAGSAAIDAPPVLKKFEPPGLRWVAERAFPDEHLVVRVAAPSQWTPDAVAASLRRIRGAVPAVLARRGLTGEKFAPDLTVLVVPQEVFCAAGTFDGPLPEDCKFSFQYFRVRERTLLVADQPALRDEIVASAVAEIVCLYNTLSPCFGPELEAAAAAMGPR